MRPVSPSAIGRSFVPNISAMLGPLGYRWFCFEDHGLKAREHLEPLPSMRDWLLTCRPEIADL
jgi:hypothetical protein